MRNPENLPVEERTPEERRAIIAKWEKERNEWMGWMVSPTPEQKARMKGHYDEVQKALIENIKIATKHIKENQWS